MAGGSFWAILRITVYLFGVWSMGKVAKEIGVSCIIFEIGAGILLGPNIHSSWRLIPLVYSKCEAEFVYFCEKDYDPWLQDRFISTKTHNDPDHYDIEISRDLHKDFVKECGDINSDYDVDCWRDKCEEARIFHCSKEPNIFTLLGHAGVALMIFESGMHFNMDMFWQHGHYAAAVAIIGTTLPIIAGIGMAALFGVGIYEGGLATGIAMAPTSVGISLRLLSESRALDTKYGQIVLTAAFLDDILSLAAFQILFSTSTNSNNMFMEAILPVLLGIAFLVVGAILSVTMWPRLIPAVLQRIPDKEIKSFRRRDSVLLFFQLLVLFTMASITNLIGSYLWGCFVAGMSFAQISGACELWERQTKRITAWMLRIFFAGTVAFSIPVADLFTLDALAQGAATGIVACIATKLLAGCFLGRMKWVVGWGMCGRAEFAYLIAEMSKTANMISARQFSVLIWALLWATLSSPVCFKISLTRYMERERKEFSKSNDASVTLARDVPDEFRILVYTKHHMTLDSDINLHFLEWKMFVLSKACSVDNSKFMGIFALKPLSLLTGEHLSGFRSKLLKKLNDADARVVFLPRVSDGKRAKTMLNVFCTAGSHVGVASEMLHTIMDSGLFVTQMVCTFHHPIHVSELSYFPDSGQYSINCILQVGRADGGEQKERFLLSHTTIVKDAIKKGMSKVLHTDADVFVEAISYDPDPLRAKLHSGMEYLEPTHTCMSNRRSIPEFYGIHVKLENDPNLRQVGVCRNMLPKVLDALYMLEYAIIALRHDHMPMAPAPCTSIIVQSLAAPAKTKGVLQNALMDALASLDNIKGDVKILPLGSNPTSWNEFQLRPHVDHREADPNYVDILKSDKVSDQLRTNPAFTRQQSFLDFAINSTLAGVDDQVTIDTTATPTSFLKRSNERANSPGAQDGSAPPRPTQEHHSDQDSCSTVEKPPYECI